MTKEERKKERENEIKKEKEVFAVFNDLIEEIQGANIEKVVEIMKIAREILDKKE